LIAIADKSIVADLVVATEVVSIVVIPLAVAFAPSVTLFAVTSPSLSISIPVI